jgi:glycerol-3-phosphate O-acyltransferase/dihydroxyacetone phosphate acyltransferase
MNQFVDGAVIVTTTPRRVGFLVAEKSMQKPIIGDFARACGSIAVARPQDKAKAGPGRIYFDQKRIVGDGTQFTKLQKGDKIRPAKSAEMYKIAQVISDTEGVLGDDMGDSDALQERCQGEGNWCTYEVMGYVDQSQMFTKVHTALANGQCIGIFPEGGSHDNTDLLPLKVRRAV